MTQEKIGQAALILEHLALKRKAPQFRGLPIVGIKVKEGTQDIPQVLLVLYHLSYLTMPPLDLGVCSTWIKLHEDGWFCITESELRNLYDQLS